MKHGLSLLHLLCVLTTDTCEEMALDCGGKVFGLATHNVKWCSTGKADYKWKYTGINEYKR